MTDLMITRTAVPAFLVGVLTLLAMGLGTPAWGAKLVDMRYVDDEHLMIQWLDGEILYKDDGQGPTAFIGHEGGSRDVVKRYEPALNVAAATDVASYTIKSLDDTSYATPAHPSMVFRRTKVNGTNNRWPEPDYTVEHTIFLRLTHKLQQGKRYTLSIAPATNSDIAARQLTFDIFSNVSEALHVNIIGYNPAHTVMKSADLYMWLGDGGARDYSNYVGKKVMLYNVASGRKHDVGTVSFWKKRGTDYGNWDLTKSDVWTCDFSAFAGTGRYRLAVDGIGCSPEFELRRDVYYEPFRTSVRGFFYMRIGMGKELNPVPRQPRFVPGVDPVNFRVYRTTFGPLHPEWKTYSGDVWDKADWSKYKEPGNPVNPNAWGGHSDAADWDRHAGHVSIIYDLLLPYLLSNGKIKDDNLGIAESGNKIPDIIDEARYEVDFWLRLRDGKGGYSWGLNNPSHDHTTMYQAHASPFMAWVNAANAALLADAFRVAGRADLMRRYRDAAVEAWNIADEKELDVSYGIGNGVSRGRDFKMLAATCLYNITGERRFEDVVAQESTVTGPTSEIDQKDKSSQYWATAMYLLCAKNRWRSIRHPKLVANMKASILREAMQKNVQPSTERPSRRSSDSTYGWFQSTQMVHPLCIAHAINDNAFEKNSMLRALILEADYGLGRNPMNMVQMTGLGSRHAQDIYTSGGNDGTPGVHPGHTPYMNANAWGQGYMADPQWYASKGYPAWEQWPHGEALWRARYSYANNEFTPQQTMRGKMLLLGYLYALGEHYTPRQANREIRDRGQ